MSQRSDAFTDAIDRTIQRGVMDTHPLGRVSHVARTVAGATQSPKRRAISALVGAGAHAFGRRAMKGGR